MRKKKIYFGIIMLIIIFFIMILTYLGMRKFNQVKINIDKIQAEEQVKKFETTKDDNIEIPQNVTKTSISNETINNKVENTNIQNIVENKIVNNNEKNIINETKNFNNVISRYDENAFYNGHLETYPNFRRTIC